MEIAKVSIKKCKYCDSQDLRVGIQNGDACLDCGKPEFLEDMTPLKHLICGSCGAVVFSWVDNPKKFIKLKDTNLE